MRFTWATIVRIGVAVVVLSCVLAGSGCGGQDTVWKADAPSPDGRWVASAETLETGGFGTGLTETDVFLKWTKGSKDPEQILGFVHDGTSTTKTINLSMKWTSPTHLGVTYDGHATVDFQVVKYGDVDISLQDISKVPNTKSW